MPKEAYIKARITAVSMSKPTFVPIPHCTPESARSSVQTTRSQVPPFSSSARLITLSRYRVARALGAALYLPYLLTTCTGMDNMSSLASPSLSAFFKNQYLKLATNELLLRMREALNNWDLPREFIPFFTQKFIIQFKQNWLRYIPSSSTCVHMVYINSLSFWELSLCFDVWILLPLRREVFCVLNNLSALQPLTRTWMIATIAHIVYTYTDCRTYSWTFYSIPSS
jgi:hypothetical protein